MGKLFLKIVVLFLFLTTVNLFLFSFIKLPFSWGNFYEKEYCLEKNAGQFNTVLIGSSRVYRQVDILLFDSLNQNSTDTHTFNFGIDGVTIAESYYEFENILKIRDLKAKYIIVELCDVDTFAKENLHTVRKKYYYDTKAYLTSVKVLWQSAYSVTRKLQSTFAHTVNLFECVSHFNSLNEIVPFRKNELNAPYGCNNFYSPLSEKDSTHNFGLNGEVTTPHKELLKHIDQLTFLRKNTKELYAGSSVNNTPGSTYFSIAQRMIEEGNKRSVKVIFVLPPKLEEIHYRNVWPVFNALPAANRIDLGNPVKYPLFYELQYAYDLGHVNEVGARFYTEALSQEFKSLINPK